MLLISQIFQMAAQVVAWIGPERDNSDHAMEWTDYLVSQIEVQISPLTIRPAANAIDITLGDLKKPLCLGQTTKDAICHLLSRPWFDRLWVRQEIILANSNAIVCCGTKHVAWLSFRCALVALFCKSVTGPHCIPELQTRLIDLGGFIFQRVPTKLVNVRETFRESKCKDPRDRI